MKKAVFSRGRWQSSRFKQVLQAVVVLIAAISIIACGDSDPNNPTLEPAIKEFLKVRSF